jgi:glyoxylase I family protein
MIRGIHHVSMKCASAEELTRVREFYCDLLGLKVVRQWPEGIMIDTGCGLIEVLCNGPGSRQTGAVRHFALEVDDVDSTAEELASAGFQPYVGPRDIVQSSDPPYHARMAFFIGPLGEQVEFFRPLD